jgi:hypothetical protein
MRLPVLAKLFETLMAILHSFSHRCRSQIRLQVITEECWLTGLGYGGRIVCIESNLNMAGRNVVYIQAE